MEAMTFALLQDLQSPPSANEVVANAPPDNGSDPASSGQTAKCLAAATANVDEGGGGVVSAGGGDGDSAAAPRALGGVPATEVVVGVADGRTATLSRCEHERQWTGFLGICSLHHSGCHHVATWG